MASPRFSVIVPHYQGSVTHKDFLRGIDSLKAQTFQDFEILCYHDGPLLEDKKLPIDVVCTNKRYNDWGHSLRDIGIRRAKGEYIIHFNPDNILYENALEVLSNHTDPIIIFQLKMKGFIEFHMNGKHFRGYDYLDEEKTKRNYSTSVVLTGEPPVWGNIDAMQLVMKRKKWLKYGGWYDKRKTSDGYMYQRFCKDTPPRYVRVVLGEHY